MDVFIWGTGQGSKIAIQFVKLLNWNIVAFIDNDIKKQGCDYENRKIIAPVNINSLKSQVGMIIVGTACREVESQARSYTNEIITYDMLLNFYKGICPVQNYESLQLREINLKNCRLLSDRLSLLDCIKEDFKTEINFVEIGVAFGDYSEEILHRCKPKKLILIDAWQGERYEKGLDNVKSKFTNEISDGKVEIKKGYSTDKLKEIENNTLDVVYIDTVHDYETTWNELLLCKDKVKASGYIAGHDYVKYNHMSKLYYGVYDAVNRFAVQYGYEFIYMTMEQEGLHSFCLRKLQK